MKLRTILPGLALLAALSMAALNTGCGTLNPETGKPEITQADLDASAVVLRSAIRGGCFAIIQNAEGNAKFVQLAVTSLDQFLLNKVAEPDALRAAIGKVVKEANDPLVALGINSGLDLYEILFGRFIKGKFAGVENALMFVKALRDGAADALPATLRPAMANYVAESQTQ